MNDLMWFPIGALVGVVVYFLLNLRATQKEASRSTKAFHQSSDAGSLACVQIVDITSTNNSYDPMGDVLSELDSEGVQTILGQELHAEMGGYM